MNVRRVFCNNSGYFFVEKKNGTRRLRGFGSPEILLLTEKFLACFASGVSIGLRI